MLELSGVRKEYGSTVVLRDATASFSTGGVTLLTGPNGSGKTTLLTCILGLETHAGEILWNGEPVRQGSGVFFPVFDDMPFYPRLSGRQNLRLLGASPHLADGGYLTESALRARVSTYSSGQRRRLALTLAMTSEAPFLILDEPMNGLDGEGVAHLREDIMRRKGTTGFLVTGHRVDLGESVVDDAFTIADGVLVRSAAGRANDHQPSDTRTGAL